MTNAPETSSVHPAIERRMKEFVASLRDPNKQLELFLQADGLIPDKDMVLCYSTSAPACHKKTDAEHLIRAFDSKGTEFSVEGERNGMSRIIISRSLWDRMKDALIKADEKTLSTEDQPSRVAAATSEEPSAQAVERQLRRSARNLRGMPERNI